MIKQKEKISYLGTSKNRRVDAALVGKSGNLFKDNILQEFLKLFCTMPLKCQRTISLFPTTTTKINFNVLGKIIQ